MGQSPSTLLDTIKGRNSLESGFVEELRVNLPKLLDSGIDINYADEEGKTALHWACTQGQSEIVKVLLSFGANPSVKDDQGCTPLTAAVFMGHSSVVTTLLDSSSSASPSNNEAIINSPNKDGMTPLHWAVVQNQVDCVEILIRHGASVSIANSKGQTPLTIVSALKPKPRQRMKDFLEYCLSTLEEGTNEGRGESVTTGIPKSPKTNGVVSKEPPSLRIRRLVALCKIWGIIKLIHPYFLYKRIDWDTSLEKALEDISAAVSPEDYRKCLSRLLSTLEDPNTRVLDPTPPGTTSSHDHPHPQPFVSWTNDRIGVFTATHHEQFGDYRVMTLFSQSIKELLQDKPSAIIFDLRLKKGASVPAGNNPFKFMFFESFRYLLPREVPLSSFRQRMMSGFPPERDFGSVFQEGVQTTAGGVVFPWIDENGEEGLQTVKTVPWIFLVNKGTPEPIIDLVGGLQTAGLARVILEADSQSSQSPEGVPELGISSFLINAGEGVTVSIRKNERVNADGTLGFFPNLVIPTGPGNVSDLAMSAALEILRGTRQLSPIKLSPGNVYVRKFSEDSVDPTPFPSTSQRILALFKLWNIVKYFFPYRDLMDEDWDSVLVHFIPRVEEVGNALDYNLLFAELVAKISDSHASVNSSILNDYFGAYSPPFEIRFVEGKSIVSHLFPTRQSVISQISLGDEIVSIDDEKISVRRNRLSKYLSASTPQALQLKIHQKLLTGKKESSVKLGVEGKGGKTITVNIVRDLPATTTKGSSRPPYSVLPEGFGFIDTLNLKTSDVDRALEVVRNTPALILDIRGYPKGIIYALAPRLIDQKVKVAVTETPLLLPSILFSEMESAKIAEDHYVQPSSNWTYKGKVVALINEETISHAEHSSLYLQACCQVTFIGSPSNGTNGNVTNLSLPGGLFVGFTGLKASYPSGSSQLQRKGIIPHIKVHPTVEGIRHAVDETYLNAVSYLKRQFPSDDSKYARRAMEEKGEDKSDGKAEKEEKAKDVST